MDILKAVHVGSALLSITGFVLRGVWMLLESDALQRRWVKVVPHVVDTVLLTTALTMVFWSAQYPLVQPWLTAKVLALLAYIVLGTIALKRGQTKATRTAALVAALAVFAYIVLVALSRKVMPFLA